MPPTPAPIPALAPVLNVEPLSAAEAGSGVKLEDGEEEEEEDDDDELMETRPVVVEEVRLDDDGVELVVLLLERVLDVDDELVEVEVDVDEVENTLITRVG